MSERTHLRDARFHLRNAIRSIEAARDEAATGRRGSNYERAAGLARRIYKALNVLDRDPR